MAIRGSRGRGGSAPPAAARRGRGERPPSPPPPPPPRAGPNRQYGDQVQPETGPIRADLLGNLWAQEWGNIYDVVAPKGAGDVGYDLTELLVRNKYTPEKIVRTGEQFFSSLGFAPLPETFWTRSMITAPRDREVICHASAWDVDNVEDLRIKRRADRQR